MWFVVFCYGSCRNLHKVMTVQGLDLQGASSSPGRWYRRESAKFCPETQWGDLPSQTRPGRGCALASALRTSWVGPSNPLPGAHTCTHMLTCTRACTHTHTHDAESARLHPQTLTCSVPASTRPIRLAASASTQHAGDPLCLGPLLNPSQIQVHILVEQIFNMCQTLFWALSR